MAIEWRDITTYGRSDAERKPSVWAADIAPSFRICVLTSHIAYKGKWVMHCEPWFDTFPLLDIPIHDVERAKRTAIALVRGKVEPVWKVLDSHTTSSFASC